MEDTVQMEEVFDAPTVEISDPLEGAFGKYLREYRQSGPNKGCRFFLILVIFTFSTQILLNLVCKKPCKWRRFSTLPT